MPALLALALALLAGCGGPSSPTEPAEPTVEAKPAPKPNVVLVTMDTVRADRIGAYGYDKAATPTFDALAGRGRRFTRAYSPYPLTIPSHSSVMTGLYPPQHGVRDNGDNVLGEEFDTLAEVLKGQGYATGASVAAFVTSRQWGFDQGFDGYFDDVPRAADFWHASRRGEEVVDDALAWADSLEGDAPVFLWVHMYDAHLPLEPVEPFASAHPQRPYDAEIAYVDAQVKRLVDHFEGEDTVFVVTADHGEGNGDHHERTHGLFVYDATQHVPLVIAGPGVPAEVVDQPVSLVDVMPTILDLVGVDAPEGLAGRPVPSTEDKPVYMETWQLANRFGFAPHIGVVHGDHKLIDVPDPELYALLTDPGERTNAVAGDKATARELKALLDGFGFEPPSAGQDAISAETAQELAALGYVVGTRPDTPVEDLPDAKDHLELIRELQSADIRHAKDVDEAIAVLRRLADQYPTIPELRVRLASFLMKSGKPKEAEKVVSEGLAIADAPQLRLALVNPLLFQKRYAEAADLLVGLRGQQEFSPRYRLQVLQALFSSGRDDEGRKLAREFMDTYPDDLEVVGILGVNLARTGNEAEAWPLLERAIGAERPPQDVAFALGMRSLAIGKGDQAMALFAKEVENHPFNWRARTMLADQAREAKDWEAWKEHTAHMVRVKPREARGWLDHAQAQFNLKAFGDARKALDQALALDPKNPDIVLLDANLLAKEGKRDEGAKRFEEARALHEARVTEAKKAP